MSKTRRPWTPEQDAYLAAHYTHSPIQELVTTLGHTILGIHRRARFLGLLRARTVATQAIRHDYFSVLDAPIKADILGLLAADGSVSSDEPRIRLALHTKDSCLVEMVRDELAPQTPLRSKGFAVQLGISSPQLVTDLARYGVVPRKSYCLEWPELLPPVRHWAFLLGYFDGDGSLVTMPRSSGAYAPQWSLYGLAGFLNAAATVIEQHTGVRPRGPVPDVRKKTLHYLRAYGSQAHAIDCWLHQDSFGLKRKRIPAPI
jgi:hypothetical protein